MAEPAVIEAGSVAGAENSNGQYLTFFVADEIYAFDILNIREIIEYGNITVVPMMPAFIAGVINLRGSVVPVVDLSSRFGHERSRISKRTSIIVLENDCGEETVEVGVVVDIVNAVLDISGADILPSPSFGTRIRADFIAGMTRVAEDFLILLEVSHVLSIDELASITGVGNDSDTGSAPDGIGTYPGRSELSG